MTPARILLVLPQMPQDPASGAARSVRTICEMLAGAGFAVHALATTATERGGRADAVEYLRAAGLDVTVIPGHTKARTRPELRFRNRGIDYHLLHIGNRPMLGWEAVCGRQFDQLFDETLRSFQPDILFTYGGSPADKHRHKRARRQGVRVVFALRNEGYLVPGLFDEMDGVLTPSRYLSDVYREAVGLESTPLPLPMELADVVATEHDPIFFTMINPSREKGLMVVARLAEDLSRKRPDIPLLIIESRGSAGRVVEAGLAGGFDLRRHENLMMSAPVPFPRDIYMPTRALLVPSLWNEPAGRVAVEAILNGIPPLVSDRGGLGEVCNGAGFVLPIPPEVTPATDRPVAPEVVEPWIELIERLEGDAAFYAEECARARQAAAMYLPEQIAPRYAEYFNRMAAR
jgi:glycosyltransferase involved in cell wall biosynthesis